MRLNHKKHVYEHDISVPEKIVLVKIRVLSTRSRYGLSTISFSAVTEFPRCDQEMT